MSDKKTQVKITVHLNERYEGRPDLVSPYVREFLQELCDMGAEQVFSHGYDPSVVTIYLEVRLDGGPVIVSTDTRTFEVLNCYSVSAAIMVRSFVEGLTWKCSNFVKNNIKGALEELRKPETVQVPTGVTYDIYPITLQVTGKGDIRRAEKAANDLRRSLSGELTSFWTFQGESEVSHTYTVGNHKPWTRATVPRSTDLCYQGFPVCLMAAKDSFGIGDAIPRFRSNLREYRASLTQWGLISD